MRVTGVTARGIITPIFKQGDDLATQVCNSLLHAADVEGFSIDDGDIIGITESVVARTQGNYATCDAIAADIRTKFGGKDLGIVFPIQSRNRFSVVLKAIAMGCEKLYVQLSYPSDEVGNSLLPKNALEEKKVNPYSDNFTEAEFRAIFGSDTVHPFTGLDYIEFYKSFGDHIEIILSNNPAYILNYTKNVLCCDIHSRENTASIVRAAGGEIVYTLADIMSQSVNGSGYNTEFGLLGSNTATPNSVKLFPQNSQPIVDRIQQLLKEKTGKTVEALVYGDGCFKDPVGGIWELADPLVSPAYTKGLEGTPNELKMKYFADNELSDLTGDALAEAMRQQINHKAENLVGTAATLGTTPRRYTDLVGSLCDLMSGSGDRGTPVVYIKGYFTNFATE